MVYAERKDVAVTVVIALTLMPDSEIPSDGSKGFPVK
jgi:hypothetical protein